MKPTKLKYGTIYEGNVNEVLQELPDQSVHCCITSPPYWALRDYGCEGQLGLEKTPQEYVANMVKVFSEVWRILRDDGTLWLNIGDSYASGEVGRVDAAITSPMLSKVQKPRAERRVKQLTGLKPKDLVGIPWRLAFALQDAGWYLRQDCIWHKPNPMPSSVRDRCTTAHEYVFLLSKSPRYYFDQFAIMERMTSPPHKPGNKKLDKSRNDHDQMQKVWGADGNRIKRDVWTITTKSYREAHFATFPKKLVEPCLFAGCPEFVCSSCGAPKIRQVKRKRVPTRKDNGKRTTKVKGIRMVEGNRDPDRHVTSVVDLGWLPSCDCGEKFIGGMVLDPFFGAGTVGVVAQEYRRRFVGVELNPEYVRMATKRINKAFRPTLFDILE